MLNLYNFRRIGNRIVIQCRHASTKQRRQAELSTPIPHKLPSQFNSAAIAHDMPHFMKSYTTWDLMCYTGLSFVTAQRWLLKLATKALPHTPTPLIKAFVCPIYTGGETFEEVRETGKKLLDRGTGNMMLSYAVEDANGDMEAATLDQSVDQIKQSIKEILVKHNTAASVRYLAKSPSAFGIAPVAPISGYIAIKPTGLMEGSADILANYTLPEYSERYTKYLEVCRSLCEFAEKCGEGKVVIVFDAEKDWLQHGVYDAQRRMMAEFNRNGKVVVAGTVQMYLQNSLQILHKEVELAKEGGYQIAMKLVRGAYLHSEPNRWDIIHRSKEDSDASYNSGINLMLDYLIADWKSGLKREGPVSRLIVASHNIESCNLVAARINSELPINVDMSSNEDVVFGQLMGMNDDQTMDLSERGFKVIKYVPWGPAQETKLYLTRRLEENGDAARGGWEHFVQGLRELKRRLLF